MAKYQVDFIGICEVRAIVEADSAEEAEHKIKDLSLDIDVVDKYYDRPHPDTEYFIHMYD